MGKKILFVTNVNPFTASFGAEQRSYVLLQAFLQNGCLVDVVYMGTTIEDDSKCPPGCRVVFWNDGHQWTFSKKANLSRLTTIRIYPVCKEQERIIDNLVTKNNYDNIACRYIPTASTAGLFKYADRLLLDIDDLPAPAMAAQMAPGKWYKELYHKCMIRSVYRETKCWIKNSRACFLPNKQQAEQYSCVFLPNIPVYHVDDVEDVENNNILFIGLMSFRPNYEGVDYFITHCWNKIINSVPDARFLIAGKGLPEAFKSKWNSYNNIEILGYVDSVTNFYAKGNIVVVPVYSGAGTNIKVIEALALGKATVLSPFSTKGYEEILDDGKNTFIADTDKDYADRVICLLKDADKRQKLSIAGYEKAMRFYSQNSINKIVANLIK